MTDHELERLVSSLESAKREVVQQSLGALGRGGRIEAIPVIVAFVEQSVNSESPQVLTEAIEAIVRLMAVVLSRTGAERPIYHQGTSSETFLSRPQEEMVWAVTAMFDKLRSDDRSEVSAAANIAHRSIIKLLRVWFPR